jgi:chaperonin cofactor prefoldin
MLLWRNDFKKFRAKLEEDLELLEHRIGVMEYMPPQEHGGTEFQKLSEEFDKL